MDQPHKPRPWQLTMWGKQGQSGSSACKMEYKDEQKTNHERKYSQIRHQSQGREKIKREKSDNRRESPTNLKYDMNTISHQSQLLRSNSHDSSSRSGSRSASSERSRSKDMIDELNGKKDGIYFDKQNSVCKYESPGRIFYEQDMRKESKKH